MRVSLVNITETNFQGEGNSNYKDYDKGICLECLNSNESSVKTEQSAKNIQVRNEEIREEIFMETKKTLQFAYCHWLVKERTRSNTCIF